MRFKIIGLNKTSEVKEKIYTIEEVYEAIKENMFDIDTSIKEVECKNKKGIRIVRIGNRTRVSVMFDGDLVKANSQRLQLFYTKGFKCVQCGIEGKFFVKVRNKRDKHYHLELIGINSSGQYVIMTKDHIIPKSKGGQDILENYQTMCFHCNNEKGNKIN